MRSVAALPLSASQRILTVEVGRGDQRRWLVLGITPHSIAQPYKVVASDGSVTVIGDGALWVDGLRIYLAKDGL